MKKIIFFIFLVSLIVFPSHITAGGPVRDVLYDRFCSPLPENEKVGCNGYIQYRIQRGRSRDKALDLCRWGCGEILQSPAKIEKCRKGCRDMNAKDH